MIVDALKLRDCLKLIRIIISFRTSTKRIDITTTIKNHQGILKCLCKEWNFYSKYEIIEISINIINIFNFCI